MEDKKLYLIHWNSREAEEYANTLRAEGYEVQSEARNGNNAINTMRRTPPDAIIIYLSREQALGRRTAGEIQRFRKLKPLPLVFVGGRDEAVAKAITEFEGATFTNSSELSEVLNRMLARKSQGILSRLKKWF